MREYEIYVPTERNDGQPVEPSELERIKKTLSEAFGGYTHLKSRSEGAWKMAGVTFRDEVTILRVLDDGSAHFDWPKFKGDLEQSLDQEEILIVSRPVEVI